jgi:alcohol dehydrogenase class IV
MRSFWNFHSAGQLALGRGSLRHLGSLVRRRQFKKLLVISDRRLEEAGLVERVQAPLKAEQIETALFLDSEPEPGIAVAQAALAQARDFCPDAIVGLGGGSNMDVAKVVAACLAHQSEPSAYFGFDNVPGPVTPLICIPTTAGTGSEVSHAAVLTDTANHIKVSTLSQYLRPALAVVDAALTDGCPRKVTADSGIDALTHAVEAYLATDFAVLPADDGAPVAYEGSYPLADVLAEKAITLVGKFLARAVDDGGDHEARDGMALAATIAGLAFSNAGVALVHGLEYPLGGAVHVSHGAGNGLLLPHVMRFNLPVRVERLATIARLLNVDTKKLSSEEAALAACDAVQDLAKSIGIPQRISELGAKREQLPDFAKKTFAIKRLLGTTPRAAGEADILAILEAAF